ncbi:MAG: hypothetical protein JO111_09880 [Caulobacteraceae bacterium]|nr:hypothetical protein [Caulobacteraceae bacterium]
MNDDVKIIKDELLDRVANQGIAHTNFAFWLGAILLLSWGAVGMWAVILSLYQEVEPPNWAVGIESSTVTAALAVIFKDHLPAVSREIRGLLDRL